MSRSHLGRLGKRLFLVTILFLFVISFQLPSACAMPEDHASGQKISQKADEEDPWAEEESKEDPWVDEESPDEPPPWAEEGESSGEEAPWDEAAEQEKSPVSLSGRFWNRISHDTSEDSPFEDDLFDHAELQLKATYEVSQGFDLVGSLDLDHYQYYNSGDWDNETNLRPHELYARFSKSWFQLTLGNQFVRWGKIDQVSPLDIVNPEDMRDGFVRTREERKLPIPMVNLKLFKGMYRFEALFIPFFYEAKLDLVGRDWAFFQHYDRSVGAFDILEADPSNDLGNSEFGFRFVGTVKKFDYAFMYFKTREDIPSFDSLDVFPGFRVQDPDSAILMDLVNFAFLSRQPIDLNYMEQDVYGFEFETTWRDFGIRGDLAYIHERSFLDDRLQRAERPVFHYALGVDYSRPGSYYINFQFSQQIVRDFDDGLLFADRVTNSVNGTLRKELWDSRLELELRYLYNFTREDYYLNPTASLKYWSNLTLQLGAEFEGGPDNSTLGIYDNNDEVYFVVQYEF